MKLFPTIIILAICFFLSACEEPLTPDQVATGFWTGVKNKDTALIKKFITRETADTEINQDEILSISDFSLGKIVIDGMQSEIETEVTLASDKPVSFPIKTHLLKQDKHWKVDYKKTIAKINTESEIAQVLNDLSNMSKLFIEGLNESMDEMDKVLPKIEEGLSNFEEEIKSKIPELREKLDEFSRKLEEALKDRKKPVENETIAI